MAIRKGSISKDVIQQSASSLRKGMGGVLTEPDIQALFNEMTDKAKKQKTVRVESSVSLSSDETKHLQSKFAVLLGHEVTVDSIINPDVLGGLRIQVGDWVIDTSLKSQLEQMATLLRT